MSEYATSLDRSADDTPRPMVLLNLEAALDLPNALARVAQYILENPGKVVHQSLAELSTACQSGQATIFRLCRELGYKGFTDFKVALATEIGQRNAEQTRSRNLAADSFDETVALICRSVTNTRDLIPPQVLTAAAQRLIQADRTVIYGSGESGIAAEIFSYRLLRTGLNAHVLRDPNLAIGTAGVLTDRSVAIAISQSGASSDTVEFAKTAHRVGAYALAVTCHPKALITKYADAVLQMARMHQPGLAGQMVGLPRSVFVAEALGLAVAKIEAANGAGKSPNKRRKK
ncbi:SIS domain-containing protein (plasmid) [Roseibium aggregatum]|uniref:MurR/RpiR family transcriptional regulator n=1 Tax=Roseibium aggregatum TaxID=187304 RepID=UPI001E62265D|nr:MurR/RpiR family transcriptional regulator [Roseibium aggregatum]UES60005.1 SIS domain-containing protein [Roseibium aggregatum]UES60129.1 SIS domain-containing protein [Roseibium aggregatum]